MTNEELEREIRRAERNARQLARLLAEDEAQGAEVRALLAGPAPVAPARPVHLPHYAVRG